LAAESPVLVVAPAMVLEGGTWDDEVAKWRPDWEPGVDVVQVAYSALCERLEHFDPKRQRNVTGPVGRARAEYRSIEWGTVLADEAHYIKGRKTLWTEAFLQIAQRSDSRVHLATGTPIPNWAHELFIHAQVLDPEAAQRGGRLGSYWRWVAQYFDTSPSRFSNGRPSVGEFRDDTPEGWLRFYEDNLGDRYLARRWIDVLPDLEPMREQIIMCPMAPAQRKAYKDLKQNYLAMVQDADGGQLEVLAWSKGGLNEKMRQVTTGLEVVAPTAKGSSGKLDRLREILSATDLPVFVAAHYRASVEAAARVASEVGRRAVFVHGGSSKPERRAAVRGFQSGEFDVLVGSIETVAEGLNFEQCHLVVRLERAWRPSRNDQVARRIRRLSNLEPKVCLDLVTPDSLDERMLPVLAAKTDQQVKALRAREIAALL
jgi:SNF2 family DNA or RNA helicase